MALTHVQGRKDNNTEFSSWSASFNFISNMYPGVGSGGVSDDQRARDNLYISGIDLEMLWETDQVFYVPLLKFLDGRYVCLELSARVPHPRGRKGPWLKTVPFVEVMNTEFVLNDSHGFDGANHYLERITRNRMRIPYKTGELFGKDFALPMVLAVLCSRKRDRDERANGVPTKHLDIVIDAIQGLKVPKHSKKRTAAARGEIGGTNFADTKALTRLMHAVLGRLKRSGFVDKDERPLRRSERSKKTRKAVEKV